LADEAAAPLINWAPINVPPVRAAMILVTWLDPTGRREVRTEYFSPRDGWSSVGPYKRLGWSPFPAPCELGEL